MEVERGLDFGWRIRLKVVENELKSGYFVGEMKG
jgi:hypothetical protein